MQIRNRHLAGVGAAACAVCCAAPVLGLLGLATAGMAATALTLAFAGFAFAVVVSAAALVALIARRLAGRRHDVCDAPTGEDAGRLTELGMPALRRDGEAV